LLLSFGKDWLKITRSSIIHVLLGLYATNTVTNAYAAAHPAQFWAGCAKNSQNVLAVQRIRRPIHFLSLPL